MKYWNLEKGLLVESDDLNYYFYKLRQLDSKKPMLLESYYWRERSRLLNSLASAASSSADVAAINASYVED